MKKKYYYIIGIVIVVICAVLFVTTSCGQKNAIVGTWEYVAQDGQETDILVFKENGDFELQVDSKSIPGAYKTEDGKLTIELSKTYEIDENGISIKEIDQPVRYQWTYVIEGDKMTLTYEDGAQGIYKKIK